MICPVRTDVGLGDSPSRFTTNNVEAVNYMIKYSLDFDPQELHVFIRAIREFIETQF